MFSTIQQDDPAFPSRLRAVHDAPKRIFVAGELPRTKTSVAIVGARAASGDSMTRAYDLAGELAAGGVVVASGGAIGVDAAAHAGAMAACARTWVVLANGLDAPYPARHRPLFAEIVDAGGALISCFEPGTPPRRWNFPRRNRVLAGLVDAVIVVEGSAASGSLYTAQAALDYDRVLGACPGSAGTDALLAQGAAMIKTADDVLAALDGRPRAPEMELPTEDTDEGRVLGVLHVADTQTADVVADATGFDAARCARALCILEIEGLALPTPGGRYVRSALAERLLGTL